MTTGEMPDWRRAGLGQDISPNPESKRIVTSWELWKEHHEAGGLQLLEC